MIPESERIPTGIQGLDPLLQGGVPQRSSTLISGPTGSGKTTFGLEFLYRGVKDHDENGLLITFEESPEELQRNLPFDWDLQELLDNKSILIIQYDPFQYEDIIDLLRTHIKEIDAKRVVIDSITALNLYVEDIKDIRKMISDINNQLKKMDCTSLLTSEIKSAQPQQISSFGVEEFIADGVIVLFVTTEEQALHNSLLIRKMRGTDHDRHIHPFMFADTGLTVKEP